MLTPLTFFPHFTSDLIQATFDRHHGASPAPFTSLNCSFGVGDYADKVQDNRRKIKKMLAINRLISARQVHGDQIFRVVEDGICDQELEGFDGLMTNMKGVGLMIQHADCQAILLHDPAQSAVAAVHCGWRGSVIGIIEKTVRMMSSCYQSRPKDLVASISPSLGPCCSEFTNHRQELPASFLAFQHRDNYFDFWQISKSQLMKAGLQADNIGTARICTSCNTNFFSYRRAKRQGDGTTGRNCSIIALMDRT